MSLFDRNFNQKSSKQRLVKFLEVMLSRRYCMLVNNVYLRTVDTKNKICINEIFKVRILMYETVQIRSRNIIDQFLNIYNET
jgi:hypothetical protein